MSLAPAYPSQMPRHDAALLPPSAKGGALFAGSLSFGDILDTVNPLQQLPIVGSIYRAVTGDTISTVARLAGGALFGGPVGLLSAAVNAGLEAATGGDIAEHVFAMFDGADRPVQVAQAARAYEKAFWLS